MQNMGLWIRHATCKIWIPWQFSNLCWREINSNHRKCSRWWPNLNKYFKWEKFWPSMTKIWADLFLYLSSFGLSNAWCHLSKYLRVILDTHFKQDFSNLQKKKKQVTKKILFISFNAQHGVGQLHHCPLLSFASFTALRNALRLFG